MSRSFAKKYVSKICTTRNSDQYFQQSYHRAARAKTNRILGEFTKYLNEDEVEELADQFINTNIDKTVRFASTWTWPSDGGSYYRGSKESIRQEIEQSVFQPDKLKNRYYTDTNAYGEYKAFQEDKNKYCYSWIKTIWETNLIPRDLKSEEDFINWYKENSNKVVDLIYKLHVRK